MAYLEPGAYSKTISNRPSTGAGAPDLTPLVIGTGTSIMVRTEVLTRGAGEFDVLPDKAVTIKSVGFAPGKSDFTHTTDYALDETDKAKLKWAEGGQSPNEGDKYSITFTYEVGDSQYLPRLISSSTELHNFYGSDIKEDGTVNNLVTATQIILELGAPKVYVIQVQTEDGTVAGADYQKALDEHAQFIDGIWRIVPADLDDSINSVIDGHVRKCSSYEERKERCVVYAKAGSEDFRTPDEVLNSVGGLASGKANGRITTVYPTKATRVFSDGVKRILTGQFVSAAYAGVEAAMPKFQSKTRASVSCFDELLGVQLTRVQKNDLAENGVLIFEQPNGQGTPCVIRHQLTTNMESAETRENSVLACKDYVAKTLRSVCENYIGKYNITPDTISRVTGSINASLAKLISDGWILEGVLGAIAQDEANPDTLIIDVKVKVPYPCNYINLTIVVD